MRIDLANQAWTLRLVDGSDDVPEAVRNAAAIPATVPGCVHTDLLAAGLIPDPYLDDHEHRLHWIGWSDWEYATTLDVDPSAANRVDLAFDGLDTIATITLNDLELGRTVNMHRRYRFDLTSLLEAGRNRLAVRFSSPERYALAEQDRLGGPYPCAEGRPYSFIRKMACNFKWDWGPDLVTAGIWRPAYLETWSTARLAQVRPLVTVENGQGRVVAHVEIERESLETQQDKGSGHRQSTTLGLRVEVAGVERQVSLGPDETSAVVELTVPEPELWWPHGYGDQPLYDLTVTLDTDPTCPERQHPLDAWHRSIGFRSLALDTAPDEIGRPFTFVINGRPIFAKGVNWIPDDCFPTRVDRARCRERLTQARDANVDLVRVWGGGIYESDDFYDACDELGILVWQDFLFACAAYNEETLAPEIDAEARDNITRLAPHPSLVLWNGNNETIWGWADGDWSEVGDRSWGRGFYLELLPSVVAELDPTRPYWGGSPYSGSIDLPPNDERFGLTHVWDVWNDVDYPAYREHRPRFASEFGFQGPASIATLRRAIDVTDPAALANRQRAEDGERKLADGLAAHFRVPEAFDDWHFLAQVNQARALRVGIEHFRSLRPHCMGTIWWQLNDCWPVHSWACIDGDGRRKPAWYAMREAYRPRLLTLQPRHGSGSDVAGLRAVLVNETRTDWAGELTVERTRFDGEVLRSWRTDVRCPVDGTVAVELSGDVGTPEDVAGELVRARLGDAEAVWFFAADRDLAYPKADFTVTTEPGVVEVTARTLLRDLTLFVDRIAPNAFVDRALVTLLPGEVARFAITSDDDLDPVRLTRPPVMRCVNDLP